MPRSLALPCCSIRRFARGWRGAARPSHAKQRLSAAGRGFTTRRLAAGAVSELLLPQPGSGELTLLLPLLASLTGQGRRVYLLQPPALPYAPARAAAGVNLQQVYWLALHDERQGFGPANKPARAR